jgi:hypothetical protein
MASLDPDQDYGWHDRASWLGSAIAFLTVMLALLAILLH